MEVWTNKAKCIQNSSDEEFLKVVKEFQNYIETYKIWNDEHTAHTVYKNFHRCLAGATKDLWDQINILKDEE
jgi:hypothetical protein